MARDDTEQVLAHHSEQQLPALPKIPQIPVAKQYDTLYLKETVISPCILQMSQAQMENWRQASTTEIH